METRKMTETDVHERLNTFFPGFTKIVDELDAIGGLEGACFTGERPSAELDGGTAVSDGFALHLKKCEHRQSALQVNFQRLFRSLTMRRSSS